jgi:hypothetical protein
MKDASPLIPAHAGIQRGSIALRQKDWVPAFARTSGLSWLEIRRLAEMSTHTTPSCPAYVPGIPIISRGVSKNEMAGTSPAMTHALNENS